jgi:hypothetical protein
MLSEVLYREARVPLLIQLRHLRRTVLRNRPAGPPAKPTIQQTGLAFSLKLARPATECLFAHPRQFRCFRLAQTVALPTAQHVSKLLSNILNPCRCSDRRIEPSTVPMHWTDH